MFQLSQNRKSLADFIEEYKDSDLYFEFNRVYLGDNKVVYSYESKDLYIEVSTWTVRLCPDLMFLSRFDSFTIQELKPWRIDVWDVQPNYTVYHET